jgi:outer membrane protein assembly factor BamB
VWNEIVFVSTAVGTGKKQETKPDEGASGERPGGPPPGDGGRRGGGGPGGRSAPIEEQDFVVLALERKSGAVRWQKKLATAMPHQGTHPDGSYASPTPVTDGERLYVSFGSYGIYALSFAGEVAWSVDLGDLEIQNGFGEGASPILCDDLLVLNWDHEGDSFLVALDKTSGKERWRTARPRGTNWSSPVLVSTGGTRQVLVAGPITIGYDPATGKELWREGEAADGRGGGAIASPVVLDGLVVFATGGRRGGEARAWAVQAPKAGETLEPLMWRTSIDGPHVPSPVAYDGKVYFLKQDSGMLSMLDPASGHVDYGPERLRGVANVYASPTSTSRAATARSRCSRPGRRSRRSASTSSTTASTPRPRSPGTSSSCAGASTCTASRSERRRGRRLRCAESESEKQSKRRVRITRWPIPRA